MQREPWAYLWDVNTAIDTIFEFTKDISNDSYQASPLIRSAVERQLEIIGEALNQLAKVDPTMAAKIPERQPAIGLRNILIHGYAMVDDSLVWRTVTNDLPVLRDCVSVLLAEAPQG